MWRLCETFMLSMCFLALGNMAWGDIPPRPNPGPEPPLVNPPAPLSVQTFHIAVDENAKRSEILIPATYLSQRDTDQENSSLSTPRTLIAGLAMSLAIGAVFFLRRSNRIGNIASMMIMGVGLSLGALGYAWANVPPPHEPPQLPSVIPLPSSVGQFPVTVNVVSKRDGILLVLSAKDYAMLRGESEAIPAPPGIDPGQIPVNPGQPKSAPRSAQPESAAPQPE